MQELTLSHVLKLLPSFVNACISVDVVNRDKAQIVMWWS